MRNKIDQSIIYDPHAVILELGKLIEGNSEKFDPATPLGMLTESIGYTTATALQEMVINNKNLYPSLSSNQEELFRHMTDDEEKDMFATPAEAYMNIFVNINDIIHKGLKTEVNSNASVNRFDIALAKNSRINVAGIDFTIMDDVDISLLIDNENNKNLSVLYTARESSYTYSGIGALPSRIIENNSIEWGVFQLPLKQLHVEMHSVKIISNSQIEVRVPLIDQYAYSEVYEVKNGVSTLLSKVFSKDIIDITNPSVFISVLEKEVIYTVPKPYILQGVISGEIHIFAYSTKGKMELPLSEFENKDFNFKLFTVNKDLKFTLSNNVAILASSKYIVDGGVNRREFRDIRRKIINKTSGIINTAVTYNQLSEKAKNKGFSIFKLLDTITDRSFVAARGYSETSVSPLDTDIEVFIPTVSLSVEYYITGLVESDDTHIYIKEMSTFKLVGDTVIPFSIPSNLNAAETSVYLNENNIFISPFFYTLYNSKSVISSRCFDLRSPDVSNISILDRNPYLLANCNIISFRLIKDSSGYDLYLEVDGNNAFTAVIDSVTVQISINTVDDLPVYFNSTIETITGAHPIFSEFEGKKLFKIRLDTDFLIKEGLKITGDLDPNNSLAVIPLLAECKVSIYSDDISLTSHITDITPVTNFAISELYSPHPNAVTITTESMTIKLGEEIHRLWNKAYGLYNKDRYSRYTVDIFDTYEEDVFEQFDGCSYKIEDTNNDGHCDTITQVLLHAAGTIKKVNGVNIIKHHAGEIIHFNGIPVLNNIGVDIFADILVIDYRYYYLSIETYTKHIDYILNQVVKWCNIDLKDLSDNMLERSSIFYRPNKNLKSVVTNDGITDGIMKPMVVIYYRESDSFDIDTTSLLKPVGKLLNIYFSKSYIDINDLEERVLEILPGNPLSVKITGTGNSIIKVIGDTRFRLGKRININNILVHNLEIKIKLI